MTPAIQLNLDGQSLNLHQRLISLTLHDKSGMEVDELTLELADHDGALALPSKGKELELAFGFTGQLLNRGRYIVDEIQHHGPPDKLIIKARSADFRHSLLEGREQSYHETTLGAIIGVIAGRHGLQGQISPELAHLEIQHLDQTNESDAHLVTRLAQEYDAVGTIKEGQLLFIPRARGQNAAGKMLPEAAIHRQECYEYEYRTQDRAQRVTGVAAYWHNHQKAKREKVLAGGGGYIRHLKHSYRHPQDAQKAAEAELKRQQHQSQHLRMQLARGRPELFAEQPLRTSGFKPEINTISWVIQTITHNLNAQGYTCTLECVEQVG